MKHAQSLIQKAVLTARDSAHRAGPVDYALIDHLYNAKYNAWFEQRCPGRKIYVGINGSDLSGQGTADNRYRTIGHAISQMDACDQVIVGQGVFAGPDNWISTRRVNVPSGASASAITLIRAEFPFLTRLLMDAPSEMYDEGPIDLRNGQMWVHIDGFVVEASYLSQTGDDNGGVLVNYSGATRSWCSRVIAKKRSVDQYGGSFNEGYLNCFEDTAHTGSSRYAYYCGSGGQDEIGGQVATRRAISQLTSGSVREPTASFATYGSNNQLWTQVRDSLYANAFEIFSPHLEHIQGEAAEDLKWSSFYHPKKVLNIRHVGCGIVDCGGEYGGFRADNYGALDEVLCTFRDCFVYGFGNGSPATATAFSKAQDNGHIHIHHCTGIGAPGGAFPANGWSGANNLTSPGIYPTLRVSGNGAEVLYAVGKFLSFADDPDAETLQDGTNGSDWLPLWPYPYEQYIGAVMAEPMLRPPLDMPRNFTTTPNHFSGLALDGNTKTITRAIWEAAGNPMPALAEIYA